jgi:Tol biopolymer transport system component
MEILVFLLERQGQLVSREQIAEKVWGKGVFLDTDNSINGAIRKIRQVLSDSPEEPRFIQTITGRGYRFIAPVVELERESARGTKPFLQPGVASSTSTVLCGGSRVALESPASTDRRNKKQLLQRRWASVAVILFAATLLPARYGPRTPRAAPPSEITHRQLTFLGDAYWPAISPDGALVAYVMGQMGQEQKLMVQGTNGPAIEVAHGGEIFGPRWSPDGSQFFYQQTRSDAEPPQIFVLAETRLNDNPRYVTRGGTEACWSPDGTQIVTAIDSLKMLELTNVKTGEAKRIPLPRFSFASALDSSYKNGLILVAVKVDGKTKIWTVRPDGSDLRTVAEEADGIESPRWAGDWIYFLRSQGSTSDLVRVSSTGREEAASTVAGGLQAGHYLTISADSSRLAYTRVDHSANLWRVETRSAEAAGKGEVKQLTFGTGYYGHPSFSPDGRWIAFALGANSTETNIFRMPVGGAPVQLTSAEHVSISSPAWSPDGRQIAFITNQTGIPKVGVVSAAGGAAQVFEQTNASDTNNYLSWYPNREIVYQQPGQQNYLKVSSSRQDERAILHPNANAWLFAKPAFSPDGGKMAAIWNRLGLGLWIISLAPYSERLLHAGEIYPIGWSPDGKHLYGSRGLYGGREIVRIDLAHPEALSVIANLPGTVTSGGIRPDGNEVVVSVEEKKSEIWMMEHFDTTRSGP